MRNKKNVCLYRTSRIHFGHFEHQEFILDTKPEKKIHHFMSLLDSHAFVVIITLDVVKLSTLNRNVNLLLLLLAGKKIFLCPLIVKEFL